MNTFLLNKNRPFGIKTYIEILEEGLQYVEDRKLGKIKSFRLPWNHLNKVGVDGLEWGSMMTIGARPGSCKTMFVSQILRESKINNSTQDFNILEFQFEMGPKQTAARDFVAQTGLDYNEVLSTTKQLDDFYFKTIKNYVDDCKKLQSLGVYRVQINEATTWREMEKAIYTCYNGLGGKPLIITIDHSWLLKKDKDEKEKINTLYNLVEMLMNIKNKLPIIILMITQLNRSIDETIRKQPGTIGNYPTSNDIFGSDALMQGSDMVVALARPYKSEIPLYGPKEYSAGPEDIFGHVIKSRNGQDDDNMFFLKANFPKQIIYQVAEPQSNNPTGTFLPRKARRAAANNFPDPNLNI